MMLRRLEHGVDRFLDTLSGMTVDYDDLAMYILDTVDEEIEKRMADVERNWDGDVDAVRADVVAQLLNDMRSKGTRVGRWEAEALSELYHEMHDEPLPAVS